MIRKMRNTMAIFLLLSFMVHLSVFVALSLKPSLPPPAERVEIEFKPEPPQATPEERQALKRKKPEVTRDQIVEQQKQINDEVDKDSRFLSAFNQKVIKQTRAANSGKFNNEAKGGKKAQGSKEGRKQEKIADKKTDHEMGDLPELKELMPKFSMDPGEQGPQADKNGDPSATDDYLKDVQNGMQTLLSTREFVYYTYYNRIKEALRQHWEPDVREKVKIIYRQGRSIASAKDRVTQVMVTLDAKGELLKVDVLTASGIQDLDSAAIKAFKDAAPFPNPPKGMIEADGTIKIRWDFVLEV